MFYIVLVFICCFWLTVNRECKYPFLFSVLAYGYILYFAIAGIVFNYRHLHLTELEKLAFVNKAMMFQTVTMEEVRQKNFMGVTEKRDEK